jgi:imidazolonepropionase-like amidohydrolase
MRIVVAVVLAVLAAIDAQAQAQVIAIKAGKLIDPDTGRTASNQVILVEKGRIQSVGTALPIPRGAAIVDLSAFTVAPGLFDAHTHLCLTTTNPRNWQEAALESTAFRALRGVANAREMLNAGFTTVRDVGNAGNYADTDLRRAIEQDLVIGPTVLNAGRIISPYGGQMQLQPERRDLATPEYFFADTRDEMKKAIRENIHFGAKVIKIVVDGFPYTYSAEDVAYIVDEARQAGLKVAAHAITETGTRNAARGGVASIEHGYEMSDEVLQLAKANGVALVGTDLTEPALQEMGFAEYTADLKQYHARIVDRLRRAHALGVTLAYGTDADYFVAGKSRGELALSLISSWIEAGIPAPSILKAMTANAARLLGVDKERGTIAPGLAADIIAMPENPLEDIRALERVRFVMKNGTIVRQP